MLDGEKDAPNQGFQAQASGREAVGRHHGERSYPGVSKLSGGSCNGDRLDVVVDPTQPVSQYS
jgi:hypothetical protein